MLAEIKEVNGLKFYVANGGKDVGVSAAALARLVGLDHSTIVKRVIGSLTDVTKTPHKSLKGFDSNKIYADILTPDRAKPLSLDFCECVIGYYAFDELNETAIASYRAFAKAGLHTWILAQVGYTLTEPELPDMRNPHYLKAAGEALLRQYNQLVNTKPGLRSTVGHISELDTRSLPQTLFSFEEYIREMRGIDADRLPQKAMEGLAGMASITYKNLHHTSPQLLIPTNRRMKGGKRICHYTQDDIPMLDNILKSVHLI